VGQGEIGSEAGEQWERTLAQARGFRRRNAGSADVLDTTGMTVPGLARQVIERTGWAGQAARSRPGQRRRKRHDPRAAGPSATNAAGAGEPGVEAVA